MNKHIIVHKLIEQENRCSKDQNKNLEKANGDIKKLLSVKNEEISWLKNHNQDLKDKIKKFEDNEESSHRSDNDLEEDKVFKQAHHGQRWRIGANPKKAKKSRIRDMSTSAIEGRTPTKVWRH